jgi:hypothetical protein
MLAVVFAAATQSCLSLATWRVQLKWVVNYWHRECRTKASECCFATNSTHMCTYVHTPAYKCTHTHTDLRTSLHLHAHARKHKCTQIRNVHTNMYRLTHMCTILCARTQRHVRTHYMRTKMYTRCRCQSAPRTWC